MKKIDWSRVWFNISLALEGVNANKLRAILTALGIIFGVGAVIAMLAIGTGAKQSILDRMKLIGTNNIVVKAVVKDANAAEEEEQSSSSSQQQGSKDKIPFSPGLSLEDASAIQDILPGVELISPEIVQSTSIIQNGKLEKARCVGVSNAFFELSNLKVTEGTYFHDLHLESGAPVCIIGRGIQARFFTDQNPIGQKIKCGNVWLEIIGILEKRNAGKENLESLGIRDVNRDVYVPVTTMLIRFGNRSKIGAKDLDEWSDEEAEDNYHQLDRITVRFLEADALRNSAEVIARMLKRRHREVVDYEVEVPELLLEQQQKTQETFNFVLAVIAGISLLVGGIGIMNIMLASILERIKEIGVRRALGATRLDIVLQFLFEAVVISLAGGIMGVLLGVGAAYAISASADIPTVITPWSILISFFVAATVGLTFGIFPARKAAKQDPIQALRSE